MDGRVQVKGEAPQEVLLTDDAPPDLPQALDEEGSEEILMDEDRPEPSEVSAPAAFQDPPPMFEEDLLADEDPVPDIPLRVSDPVVPKPINTTDLSKLANEIDSGSEVVGGLRYNLIIQGIDTVDLRREVRDSLLDAKFGWDVDQLLKSAQGGKMEIKSISALKAQIVVQRLKVLPLQIRWEQHADI